MSFLQFCLPLFAPGFGGGGIGGAPGGRGANIADLISAARGSGGLMGGGVQASRLTADDQRAALRALREDDDYVTESELAAVLGAYGVRSIGVAMRSAEESVAATSGSETITGVFDPGNVLVVFAQKTGAGGTDPGVSCARYLTVLVDGQSVQGGQSIPFTPLAGTGQICIVPLDKGGQSLAISFTLFFETGDNVTFGSFVFRDAETAQSFLSAIAR